MTLYEKIKSGEYKVALVHDPVGVTLQEGIQDAVIFGMVFNSEPVEGESDIFKKWIKQAEKYTKIIEKNKDKLGWSYAGKNGEMFALDKAEGWPCHGMMYGMSLEGQMIWMEEKEDGHFEEQVYESEYRAIQIRKLPYREQERLYLSEDFAINNGLFNHHKGVGNPCNAPMPRYRLVRPGNGFRKTLIINFFGAEIGHITDDLGSGHKLKINEEFLYCG